MAGGMNPLHTAPEPDSAKTAANASHEFNTPRLVDAGWAASPHAIAEKCNFTEGRIIFTGGRGGPLSRRVVPMAVVAA
jgi:hypothetical protein